MYKIAEFNDGKSNPGQYKKEFQGSYLQDCHCMIYWFLWKDYTFDIREVRKHFGKKEEKAIDVDWKINQCTKFQKQMSEIIELVGKRDFEEVLLEIVNNPKPKKEIVLVEDDDDDFPF